MCFGAAKNNVFPLRNFVTSDTGIAAGQYDTATVFLAVKILVSKVTVLGRVTEQYGRLTLVNNLDPLCSDKNFCKLVRSHNLTNRHSFA